MNNEKISVFNKFDFNFFASGSSKSEKIVCVRNTETGGR